MKAYFNYIQPITISKNLAKIGSHQGDCAKDIQRISELSEIKRQLNKINAEELKKELSEYGAWDDEQLSDHAENIQRILWIACGNIIEEN